MKEQKVLIFLRGMPGVGKITVARILKERLDYQIFWFHDLKNVIQDIVGKYRIPQLMDKVQVPVLEELLNDGKNIIYVRPAPGVETVQPVEDLIDKYPNYKLFLITLVADRKELEKRVITRQDPYRITTKDKLDEYFATKPEFTKLENDFWIDTTGLKPEEVADIILKYVANKPR